MNSFGRQEGGGFRRREGKLVSPVRRILAPTPTNNRHGKEGEETWRKRERTPPLLKVPPPGKKEERREGGEKKKLVREKNNKKLLTNERKKIL